MKGCRSHKDSSHLKGLAYDIKTMCRSCWLHENDANYGGEALVKCPTCPGNVKIKVSINTPVESMLKLLQGGVSPASMPAGWNLWKNSQDAHRRLLDEVKEKIKKIPAPQTHKKGILILSTFPDVHYCYKLILPLRQLGCTLPIEVWHHGLSGFKELPDVSYHDMSALSDKPRVLCPKILSLMHTSFTEVLAIGPSKIPLKNPESIFDFYEDYKKHGALFLGKYEMLINKQRVNDQLLLSRHYADHFDYYRDSGMRLGFNPYIQYLDSEYFFDEQ